MIKSGYQSFWKFWFPSWNMNGSEYFREEAKCSESRYSDYVQNPYYITTYSYSDEVVIGMCHMIIWLSIVLFNGFIFTVKKSYAPVRPSSKDSNSEKSLYSVVNWNSFKWVWFFLRGYCTPDQFCECLCIFLKNYNTLVTNKMCFL